MIYSNKKICLNFLEMPSIKIKHNCSQKDKFKNLSQERKNVNLTDKTKDIKEVL